MPLDIVIGWQPYETVFHGHKVTMELRPLKSWAMFALAPYLEGERRKPDESVKDFVKRLTPEQKEKLSKSSRKIQGLAKDIFPEHVQNIQGITVNKEPVTWEHLAEETIFMTLAVEISGQLAAISSLDEMSAKNSKAPSDSTKQDGA